MKLQHAAGYPTLSVQCDYKSQGICQHPLLHDLDGRSSAVFDLVGLGDSSNLETGSKRHFNTKSRAISGSAVFKAYKSKVTSYTGVRI